MVDNFVKYWSVDDEVVRMRVGELKHLLADPLLHPTDRNTLLKEMREMAFILGDMTLAKRYPLDTEEDVND